MTIRQEADNELRAPSGVIAEYLRRSISIAELVHRIWSGWIIVVAMGVIGLLYGIYSVHQAGPMYVATMRISPAESDGSGIDSLSSSGGAGGLLAGLTGNAGAVAVPKFTQFTVSIGSIGVAKTLNQKYDLLCKLYKSRCDPITHTWKSRTGLKPWFDGLLASLQGLPDPNGPPTDADLAAYLSGAVAIATNKLNSIVVLSYNYPKPEIAAQQLSMIVQTANDYVRAQSRETQKRYVQYLSDNAIRATNVEQRQAIDTLLLQEERQLMMTEVDIPYAAKILDGPTVQPLNTALKTLAIYTFIGFFAGVIIALFRNVLPRWRAR